MFRIIGRVGPCRADSAKFFAPKFLLSAAVIYGFARVPGSRRPDCGHHRRHRSAACCRSGAGRLREEARSQACGFKEVVPPSGLCETAGTQLSPGGSPDQPEQGYRSGIAGQEFQICRDKTALRHNAPPLSCHAAGSHRTPPALQAACTPPVTLPAPSSIGQLRNNCYNCNLERIAEC